MAGKSEQQKQPLADRIARDVMSVLNYGEESVSVAIEEIPPQLGRRKYTNPTSLRTRKRCTRNLGMTYPNYPERPTKRLTNINMRRN